VDGRGQLRKQDTSSVHACIELAAASWTNLNVMRRQQCEPPPKLHFTTEKTSISGLRHVEIEKVPSILRADRKHFKEAVAIASIHRHHMAGEHARCLYKASGRIALPERRKRGRGNVDGAGGRACLLFAGREHRVFSNRNRPRPTRVCQLAVVIG
jgi:hypothetical protein